LLIGKEAAHGFRNLSVYTIVLAFERPVTQMKTKFDEIVNNPPSRQKRGSPPDFPVLPGGFSFPAVDFS